MMQHYMTNYVKHLRTYYSCQAKSKIGQRECIASIKTSYQSVFTDHNENKFRIENTVIRNKDELLVSLVNSTRNVESTSTYICVHELIS